MDRRLCGAIRYEANVTTSENWYCHCRMCQKASGSVVSTSAIVPKSQVQITKGDPKFYQSSQYIERGFYSDCGSPMFFSNRPTSWLTILSGTLDDPELAPPAVHAALTSYVRECLGELGKAQQIVDRPELVHMPEERLDARSLRFETLVAHQRVEPDDAPA